MTRPTALVLRALGLGDFFTGLPALRLLRDALPEHRIVLAAPTWLAPLVQLAGAVDAQVHAHELEPIVQPPHRPELAIDMHGNGPESRGLLLETEPDRLIAFNHDGLQWRADAHEARRWCRLLVEGLGLPANTVLPSVVGALPEPVDVPAPTGWTVLHCGAKSAARRWPAERFAALAILLRAHGHEVVITGGPDERALAKAIGAAAGVRVYDQLSVLELVALIARARLLVSGDTGVAHVATNFATPSVVLFGPVSPAVWGPPADPRHQVLWHGDGSGDPHANRPDPALLAITVREVLTAVEQVKCPTARQLQPRSSPRPNDPRPERASGEANIDNRAAIAGTGLRIDKG